MNTAARWAKGEWLFFSHQWKQLGTAFDWLTHPVSGKRYNEQQHYTGVKTLDAVAGDIKYVWEPSRFSFIYTMVRCDAANGTDHAEWVFNKMDNWIANNPINCGPNWNCSQEISLRTFNWYFALTYYCNHKSLTEARFANYMHVIRWSLHHVYHNIYFSLKSVRNNHAITETLALYLGGTWFPFLPDAAKWKAKGKKWFEQEIAYQIYEDGTFLQYSMNYHRVVVQLLAWGIAWANKYGQKYSEVVYDRAWKSVHFLYQCQEESNGWLSNYGSNDGAWFFPLSQTNYRDYRPQLNALHVLLTGSPLYQVQGNWQEEASWLGQIKLASPMPAIEKQYGCISFINSGYYLYRNGHGLTLIRCGNHKDRPIQADNLHMDIWYKGQNILYDTGSYQYNTSPDIIRYFHGGQGHNVIMVNGMDQMMKGPRFIWWHWSQCKYATWKEEAGAFVFEGAISAFTYWDINCIVKRKVRISKIESRWEITDTIITDKPVESIEQRWHVNVRSKLLNWVANDKNGVIKPVMGQGAYSDYYGAKEEGVVRKYTSAEKEIITVFEMGPDSRDMIATSII